MTLYLQFVAALVTYDILRAVVPRACIRLREKINSHRFRQTMEREEAARREFQTKLMARQDVNFKPNRETR